MDIFDQIKAGLEEAIVYESGIDTNPGNLGCDGDIAVSTRLSVPEVI